MKTAVRGALLTFRNDPFLHTMQDCMAYESDAIIVMENGKITHVDQAQKLLPHLPNDLSIKHYPNKLIIAGFIDCHVHYPQTEMIAAYGKQLIDWLNNYTFVVEQKFSLKSYAAATAKIFLQEQFRHGVTAAAIYSTTFPVSVDAIFEEAAYYNMRIISGKMCMDRNAPTALLDSPQQAYDNSKILIQKWHKNRRAEYAITPRFALTSTPEQLELLGALAQEFPDTIIQSHLSENKNEINLAKSLFPKCKTYTEIYQQYGLLRQRAIYGHGVHLTEPELEILYANNTAIAHCPSSNFFLGSGYFNIQQAKNSNYPIKVGLATDLGAGTNFSILQTMKDAYSAAQLNGFALSAGQAFYLATLGSATALGLDNKIGSIEVGKEADLTILDLYSTPLIKHRMQYAKDIDEILFIQLILGDDRAIEATYIAGSCVYHKQDTQ